MKKFLLVFMGAVLLFSLVATPALADPKEGLVAANKNRHIARDPLINGDGDTSGWVTFNCESPQGFEYSVAVKGLKSNTTYTVRAESLGFVFLPFPPFNGWVPTTDGAGNTYALGTIKTNGKGEGELEGIYSLGPGSYAWEIIVDDGTYDVLWTIPDAYPVPSGDPADFGVTP